MAAPSKRQAGGTAGAPAARGLGRAAEGLPLAEGPPAPAGPGPTVPFAQPPRGDGKRRWWSGGPGGQEGRRLASGREAFLLVPV